MVATGLALMFGVVRLINFAHGEFYMLGGYAFWYALPRAGAAAIRWPALAAAAVMARLRARLRAHGDPHDPGPHLARAAHRHAGHLDHAHQPGHHRLRHPAQGGADARCPRAILDGGRRPPGVAAAARAGRRVVIFAGARVVRGPRPLGKAMRAMSQNREACAVVGVDVQRVALVTFAHLGGAGRGGGRARSRRSSTSSPTWAPLLDPQGLRGGDHGRLRLRQGRHRGRAS